MQPFRKILFAADFSDNSKEAFHAACSVAVEETTRIFVLHVDEPRWVAREPVYFGQQSVQFHAEAEDQAQIDQALRKMRAIYSTGRRIDLEYQTREGDPSREILRTAKEIDCDLIAMGTHGLTGLRGLIAGSVAVSVLRRAHCPVLALRSAEHPRETEEIRVILHPTDFSIASEAALNVARQIACHHGARLIILNVATIDTLVDGAAAAEIDPHVYREAIEDLSERISGPDLKHPVETVLTSGFAPEGIAYTADQVGCDLIVIGTHGRIGLTRLLMGSVAENVLTLSNCPVLIVKAPRGVVAVTASNPAEELVSVH